MSDTKKVAIGILCACYGVYTAVSMYQKVVMAIEAKEQEEKTSPSEEAMQKEYETAPDEVVTATA